MTESEVEELTDQIRQERDVDTKPDTVEVEP